MLPFAAILSGIIWPQLFNAVAACCLLAFQITTALESPSFPSTLPPVSSMSFIITHPKRKKRRRRRGGHSIKGKLVHPLHVFCLAPRPPSPPSCAGPRDQYYPCPRPGLSPPPWRPPLSLSQTHSLSCQRRALSPFHPVWQARYIFPLVIFPFPSQALHGPFPFFPVFPLEAAFLVTTTTSYSYSF